MTWECLLPCSNVDFLVTNESPISVLGGLRVKTGDNILAICGSGDIPFAMVGRGANVLAIDKEISQVIYVDGRKEILSRGMWYEAGMGETHHPKAIKRDKYFLSVDREKIFSGVNNLEIDCLDVFSKDLEFKDFNKVYLSNVIPHEILDKHGERACYDDFYCRDFFWDYIKDIGKKCLAGTTIYSSFGFKNPTPPLFEILEKETKFARKNEMKFNEVVVCKVG